MRTESWRLNQFIGAEGISRRVQNTNPNSLLNRTSMTREFLSYEESPAEIFLFWVVASSGLVDEYKRFEETYGIYLQGWSLHDVKIHRTVSANLNALWESQISNFLRLSECQLSCYMNRAQRRVSTSRKKNKTTEIIYLKRLQHPIWVSIFAVWQGYGYPKFFRGFSQTLYTNVVS